MASLLRPYVSYVSLTSPLSYSHYNRRHPIVYARAIGFSPILASILIAALNLAYVPGVLLLVSLSDRTDVTNDFNLRSRIHARRLPPLVPINLAQRTSYILYPLGIFRWRVPSCI